jgi:hypothetical protein
MNLTSTQALNEMVEYPIPDDVRRFILESIDSIAQLEALLLLRRSPNEEWSAQKVARRLYISEQDATSLLARLSAEGLIAFSNDKPPLCRYQPDSDGLALIIDRLAETYSKHLVPLTSSPNEREDAF